MDERRSQPKRRQQLPELKVAEEPVKRDDTPEYRKCRLCYTGYGGIGRAYHTSQRTRYYKCQECGYSWSVDLEQQLIRYTIVREPE